MDTSPVKTDRELVLDIRNGQSSSYEVLVRRWSARLVAYVRSKVIQQDTAEDIAQDCLLKAFRSLNTLEQPERFGAWLLSIGHRASIDWLKAKSRKDVPLQDSSHEPPTADAVTQPLEACIQREEQTEMVRAVMSLPEPLREVVLMYYYDNVTYQQLAQALGVSSATINARLTKARKLLRTIMSDSEKAR